MTTDDHVHRSFAIVDQTLRATFPDSYWKRCTYAAFGMRMLLRETGIDARIVFGDMMCFTLSTDAKRPSMEGYGSGHGAAPAHYWVEAAGHLIDLGPHYLPREARRQIAPMPLVRWSLDTPLPLYLRYRERGRELFEIQPDPSIAARVADFLDRCRTCSRSNPNAVTLPRWELIHAASLQSAARRGDVWARGAWLFASRPDLAKLPF